MKFKDIVFLKEDKKEYLEKGIRKENSWGIVMSPESEGGKWQIGFLDKHTDVIYGDVWVTEDDVEVWIDPDEIKGLSCDGEKFDDYDEVELVNLRATDKKLGLYIGARGWVMRAKVVRGHVDVDFGNVGNDNYVCTGIMGQDLKIIKKYISKETIPEKPELSYDDKEIKFNDRVELVNDKKKYYDEGQVVKGFQGTVVSKKHYDGYWWVHFEITPGYVRKKNTSTILVMGRDLKLISK